MNKPLKMTVDYSYKKIKHKFIKLQRTSSKAKRDVREGHRIAIDVCERYLNFSDLTELIHKLFDINTPSSLL